MPLLDARPKVLGLDPTVLSYTVESGQNSTRCSHLISDKKKS